MWEIVICKCKWLTTLRFLLNYCVVTHSVDSGKNMYEGGVIQKLTEEWKMFHNRCMKRWPSEWMLPLVSAVEMMVSDVGCSMVQLFSTVGSLTGQGATSDLWFHYPTCVLHSEVNKSDPHNTPEYTSLKEQWIFSFIALVLLQHFLCVLYIMVLQFVLK